MTRRRIGSAGIVETGRPSALIADAGQGDGCEATDHLIGQVPLIS
jgi:hypothetical protein